MDTKPDIAKSADRNEIAASLRAQKGSIFAAWETRVRKELPAAQGKSGPCLRDHLPALFDELDWVLKAAVQADAGAKSGQNHGRHRARLCDYTLEQVIEEYRILRQVLLKALGAKVAIDPGTMILIHDAFDRSIVEATAEFTREGAQRESKSRLVQDRLVGQMATQYAVARILASQEEPPVVMSRVLETICVRKKWDLGAVWYANPAADRIDCIQTWQSPSCPADHFIAISRSRSLRKGEGLPGKVWETGQVHTTKDVRESADFPRLAIAQEEGLRGAVAFPVWIGNAVHGVIELYSHEEREPDEMMSDLIKSLGSQLGQFIERKQSEAALRRSEAAKAAVIETALDGIIGMDHQGRVTEFNPAAQSIFGYQRAEALGRRMNELFIMPEQREEYRDGLMRSLSARKPQCLGKRHEFRALRKDGTEITVEISIAEVPNSEPPSFTGFIRDITERKRMENELRKSHQEFQTLADMIPQLAWVADSSGHAYWYNRRWFDYTGATHEELQARGWKSVHHPDHVDRVDRNFQKACESGAPWEDTFPLRSKDGEWHWFLSRAVPVRDEQGRVVRWFGTNTDITEERRARLELKKQRQELEDERDMRERFIATLTHDLRNPLTAAKSSTQIVLKYPEKAEARERLLTRAVHSLERADRMIQDLLDVNQIKAGQTLSIRIVECDLNAVVQEVLDELTVVHGDRFVLHSDPDEASALHGHWSCEGLRRVVENLATNAVKYGAPGTPIRITLATSGKDHVLLSVHNLGSMIPKDQQELLFRPFIRTAEARESGKRGWGLGLALVRGIAQAHGGTIEVSSSAEEGTAFTVRLPRDARPVAKAA